MREWLQNAAMKIVDWAMAATTQPQPSQFALRNCKVISHRGEHDNIKVVENTLTAFSNARANGVWGIECDIRWTLDLVPVITHDSCGSRLKARHVQEGQRIGTGFISSKNCLFRELNRGVEWIFRNDAVKIQGIRDRHFEG